MRESFEFSTLNFLASTALFFCPRSGQKNWGRNRDFRDLERLKSMDLKPVLLSPETDRVEFRAIRAYAFESGHSRDTHGTPIMSTLLTRITIDPAICHGQPCIRGLRYPVQNLLELLSSGMTIPEILEDYEDLEKEDLLAALAWAARLAQSRRLQSVNP